jgi:hypothetical protein
MSIIRTALVSGCLALASAALASDQDGAPDLGLHLSLAQRLRFGISPFAGNGAIPWSEADTLRGDRRDRFAYGVLVGTYLKVNDRVTVGIEVPYLAGHYTAADSGGIGRLQPSTQADLRLDAAFSIAIHF